MSVLLMLRRGGSSPPRHDIYCSCICTQPRRRSEKNSQLLQCQRYSAQRRLLLHVNPLSAGATPFKTVSQCHGGLPKPRCQKDHICPAGRPMCWEVLKSLSNFCASVKDLYLCCRFERACALGIIAFLPFTRIRPSKQRGAVPLDVQAEEGKKFCKYSLHFFIYLFFNWWILQSPCAWVLFVF